MSLVWFDLIRVFCQFGRTVSSDHDLVDLHNWLSLGGARLGPGPSRDEVVMDIAKLNSGYIMEPELCWT